MHREPSRTTHLWFALICISLLITSPLLTKGTPGKLQEGNDASAYNAKGLELYSAGKYEDAVKSYKQAIKLKQDYADAHNNLGDFYFTMAQFKKAVEAYKQAIRYQPDLAPTHNKVGLAYARLGEAKKAIAAFNEAIRLDPKAGMPYFNLAATYLERGKEQPALDQYRILKAIDPALARRLYLLISKPMATAFDGVGVRLNVIATDSQGVPVDDLSQEDFQVFEDGVPQTITSFSKDQFPIVYALTVDTSGSLRPAFDLAIAACKTTIQANLPSDETLLVRFVSSDKIETVQEFTSDRKPLNDGLDTLYIESGQSAILDGVFLSAQRVAQYKASNSPYLRRAVVLVTDGDERASYYTMDDLLSLLHKIDVQVFVIGLAKGEKSGDKLNQGTPLRAVALLTKLASETGGQAFFPKSVSELEVMIKQMVKMMRTQYVIGYKPVASVVAETYHQVRVNIVDKAGRDRRSALIRPGYVVPKKAVPVE
jgi:Ca-activated chloride channel family protein